MSQDVVVNAGFVCDRTVILGKAVKEGPCKR